MDWKENMSERIQLINEIILLRGNAMVKNLREYMEGRL